MNPKVDQYLIDGCGRCALGGTPECKVNRWAEELKLLRSIVLDCGLKEEVKWGVPCYTYSNGNVLTVSAFKAFSVLSFFKGSLLKDDKNLLVKPGENSQATRMFRFNNVEGIVKFESDIKAYIYESIEIEKAGLKVNFKKNPESIPEELQTKLDEDPTFNTAFEALTPGRQRGYILYFSAPKQSKTRISRIEKYIPRIFEGKGMHDR